MINGFNNIKYLQNESKNDHCSQLIKIDAPHAKYKPKNPTAPKA